ncbi:DnaJ family domain-containing protein [Bacillus fonticola]|uniref:DnaJ family domain-containing protein n=1 Tax=Bacillus fonticola TaxID=2728853 RepID=UPI001476435A|nr:DUF1992 domain-containing protein [Bacillus fonticola]
MTEHWIEDVIRKAYKDGDFNNLPGQGKPLPKDEAAHLPEELRMAYRVLKNSGFTPEKDALQQELTSLNDLMRSATDPDKQEELQGEINKRLLQWNRLLSERKEMTNSGVFKKYEQKARVQITEHSTNKKRT